MAEAMDTAPLHEEWDRFFQLDNQEGLLDTIDTKTNPPFLPFDDDSTSPSVPSLDFHAHSTGNSSPSEVENFSACFSPTYQLPPAMESPTRRHGSNPKKRKNLDGQSAPTTRQPRGQKISHNVIEKRYRSNLNDKIARLRDSVPELRTAAPTVKRRPTKVHASDSEGSGDEGAGLKFNKATVLTKATEYIQQLERQNQKLMSELSVLRNRAGPVEKLRNPPAISTSVVIDCAESHVSQGPAASMALPKTPQGRPSPSEATDISPGLIRVPDEVRRLRDEAKPEQHYASSVLGMEAESHEQADPFSQPVQGLITLPKEFQRLRDEAAAQDHFAPESSYYRSLEPSDEVFMDGDDGEDGPSGWPRSKALSRVLVGSLAGLMVMEGFSEKEDRREGIEKRGLFSLPTELLTESRGFRAQIRQRILSFSASIGPNRALPLLTVTATLFLLSFVLYIYFAPRRWKTRQAGTYDYAEGFGTADPRTMGSATRSPSPPILHRTYSPPPDAAIESEVMTWDMRLVDRVAMEWFGVSIPSRGVDEEAARRAIRPRPDLSALRNIAQSLFMQRSNS